MDRPHARAACRASEHGPSSIRERPGGRRGSLRCDEERAEDDWVIERDGVVAVIDAMSYQYLVGSEVDYTEGLEGARFVVNNPNAVTTCGCGASFSI